MPHDLHSEQSSSRTRTVAVRERIRIHVGDGQGNMRELSGGEPDSAVARLIEDAAHVCACRAML